MSATNKVSAQCIALASGLAFAAVSLIAAAPAMSQALRDPVGGMSVLGGSSGSSGVMHQTHSRPSVNTYTPQRGQVRHYRSRKGTTSSLPSTVKSKHGKKLTDEAASLYAQALVDDKNGKYNDAVLKLQKSLAIREFYWREHDRNIPVVINKLAEVLGKQKKYDEAAQHLERSLAYCSRIFGAGTIERVPALVLMGENYQKKKDPAKSFDCYKQAYTLVDRAKGKCAESGKLRLAMARAAKDSNWTRTTCELYEELLAKHASGFSQVELSSIGKEYSDVLRKDGREDEANAVLAKVGSLEGSLEGTTVIREGGEADQERSIVPEAQNSPLSGTAGGPTAAAK